MLQRGKNSFVEPNILYEDDTFFVVEKPSGFITNDSNTVTTQPVLEKWISKFFDYPLKEDVLRRSGIVHRLDKETSGIVVIAKTIASFEALQSEFKNREVKKTYTALLHGKLDPATGRVDLKVGRLPWRRDRFGVVPDGRLSASEYKVLEFYPEQRGGYTLTEFYPITGRTHQLRIHAKHLGHAIVSDEFYAGRKTARNDRKFCPRLFLHASEIKFIHPLSRKAVHFVSRLPDDLSNVLKVLRKDG